MRCTIFRPDSARGYELTLNRRFCHLGRAEAAEACSGMEERGKDYVG